MKKFIVKICDKRLSVKAENYEQALNIAKLVVRDETTQLDVIKALVTDEQAAIAAYTNAIANLDGKVDAQYIAVLQNILKEENKHVENLQAIITGNVTEKNVEDSVKDEKIKAGAQFTSKSGHNIKIVSIDDVDFSPVDGSVVVKLTYDYEMTDGKKGRSSGTNLDLRNMLKM